ncbi:MAG: hypothetical protein HGA22_10255 [Clostridiales bacterium]|nr:hypothetical protein [Clostridiales bacterium]
MKALFNHAMNFGPGGFDMSVREMISASSNLGFQGIELLCPFNEETASILAEYGMKAVHVMQNLDTPGFFENLPAMQKAGVKFINVSPPVYDHESALRAAELLNAEGRRASAYGLKVYFHNHLDEFWFDEIAGQYLWETVVQNTNPDTVSFQLDAGYSNMAGADTSYLLKKYRGRVELLHLRPCTKITGPVKPINLPANPDDPRPGEPGFSFNGAPPPEILPIIALCMSAEGPFSESIHNTAEIMETAEACGCKAITYVRNKYPDGNNLLAIGEDMKYFRKFW